MVQLTSKSFESENIGMGVMFVSKSKAGYWEHGRQIYLQIFGTEIIIYTTEHYAAN